MEMSSSQLENRERGKTRIPILTYHSIDESGSVISTAPDTFRWQMKFLHDSGYRTVTLRDLVDSFLKKRRVSPKTVVLTFDDGFQNFCTTAFPVLEEFGMTATVFLVTDHCGKFNDWSENPPELPRSVMLSWAEVEELSHRGIEFGGHSRTHRDLTKLSETDAMAEIAGSKRTLEDRLGREATTFAYPYGRHSDRVRQIVKNTFAAACSTNLGKVTTFSDLYSLERVDSYYLSNPRIFESLSLRSFDRYLQVRQAIRSFKSLINRG